MKVLETLFKHCYILEPTIHSDNRGYFFESYSKSTFHDNDLHYNFIQDNESYSKYGTIRGLHFQKGNSSQAKLVRVLKGEVLDVIVDLRKDSPTFLNVGTFILNDINKHQLLIPRGFAHGFSVLSDQAIFQYKVDNYYAPKDETGIVFSDSQLNIDWKIPREHILVSDKDLKLPPLSAALEKL